MFSVVAFLIFVFLRETGARENHGNFFWQNVITTYALFLVLAAGVFTRVQSDGWNQRLLLCAAVFFLHSISGCVYLLRLLLTGIAV